MQDQVQMNPGLLIAASTGFKQDINAFLEKPYPLQIGQLSSTDTVGTFTPFQLWSTISALDIYKSKLKGGLGIRGTVVLRIQLNGDRFMQGRYILGFLPFVTTTQGTNGSDILHSVDRKMQMMASKTSVTQLPRVEIDLNCDTEAVLEIPYVSPYSHYSLNSGHGDVGSVFLYPYSPLVTGTTGSSTCQYTIWCSLKNIEIVGPTLPQMAMKGMPNSRPAGRVRKKGTVTEEEQRSADIGPIESVLRKVSRAADVVGVIPILTAVAKPVSWATDILAGAANVFGWSKPLSLAPPSRMQHIWAPFWNNPDAADYSQPMSMMANNSLEVLPGFAGTDIDETSIDFVKTIPAWFTTVTWSTTNVNGDKLFQSSCAPGLFFNDLNDGAATYRMHLPVGFLATLFNNYRGSLRFTFKLVKTEFHSGRLVFSFAPRQLDTTTAFSITDSTYLHREIIDVRLGNEFSFVVPYASVQQYRGVTSSYGTVQLNVLNQLTAPASVNSSISVLIEVSAAPDMEFSFPAAPYMTPFVPLTTQSNFEFQMDSGNECSIVDGIIAGGSLFDDKLAAARFCVGEKVSSLMSFLKQSKMLRSSSTPTTTNGMSLSPFTTMSSASYYASSKYGVNKDVFTGDMYAILLSCYGMSRGGIRLKAKVPQTVAGLTAEASMYKTLSTYGAQDVIVYDNFGVFNNSTTQSYGNAMRQVYNTGASTVDIQVPQYGKFPSRLNQELWPNTAGQLANLIYPGVPDQTVWLEFNNTITPPTVFRSVADDFQLGFFICIPPMLMSS